MWCGCSFAWILGVEIQNWEFCALWDPLQAVELEFQVLFPLLADTVFLQGGFWHSGGAEGALWCGGQTSGGGSDPGQKRWAEFLSCPFPRFHHSQGLAGIVAQLLTQNGISLLKNVSNMWLIRELYPTEIPNPFLQFQWDFSLQGAIPLE